MCTHRQVRRTRRLRRREFRALKVKVTDDTVTALLDGVGSDIRELASVCSQLVADTDGQVDAAAVRRYHSGKAEVKGFDIADKAVVGDVAGAAEALRWAMMSGEPHVVLADALAESVHTIARVALLSGDPYRLAADLGMPPWRVQKAQKQSRRWSRASVAEAIRLVAALNADVKGAAADADYALESTVRKVAELAGGLTDQILLNAEASADLRLAAWFLWMTPLLAALSSLRLVETSNSPAFSLSPVSTASRNPRTAV